METPSAAAPERSPVMEIPGTYGLSFIGAILDRFEYFKGTDKFFERRVEKYKSTVFRVNMPPGPPFFSYNRVIILRDGKSFPVLYDLSKVDKSYLAGSYMPSLKFTGGYRPTIFMDPSCEKHHRLKRWCLDLLCRNRERNFPEFPEFSTMSLPISKSNAGFHMWLGLQSNNKV